MCFQTVCNKYSNLRVHLSALASYLTGTSLTVTRSIVIGEVVAWLACLVPWNPVEAINV
jgi:hypothetical protein